MKSHRKNPAEDKELLKGLGDFIGSRVKKGLSKVEEIFKDDLNADDKLFSYFKVFMDDKGVASVTPSSKYLVERTVKAMDLGSAKAVIEYGAAEGVMTRRILQKLPMDARFVAIELNERLFDSLSSNLSDPRLSAVCGDVRDVKAIAARHGLAGADVVVSGIPFAFLSEEGRNELLAKTAALLKPGGRFVAYQVTTHLMPLLKKHFRRVKTQFEIRNIPPHFIFTAFK